MTTGHLLVLMNWFGILKGDALLRNVCKLEGFCSKGRPGSAWSSYFRPACSSGFSMSCVY